MKCLLHPKKIHVSTCFLINDFFSTDFTFYLVLQEENRYNIILFKKKKKKELVVNMSQMHRPSVYIDFGS
jgi:hypothetical protein